MTEHGLIVQPVLQLGAITVSTKTHFLGEHPDLKPWVPSPVKSPASKHWLQSGLPHLPDRHKHSMGLNVEIQQACEMFRL